MTDAERLGIVSGQHGREMVGLSGYKPVPWCQKCGVPWPCDTAVALAEVERLRGAVEAAHQDFLDGEAGDANRRLCEPLGHPPLSCYASWRPTVEHD